MTLKARYKLNGNVEEEISKQKTEKIVGNINTDCLNTQYNKKTQYTISNINVFINSNYIATIESGYYLCVYDTIGNLVWSTDKNYTNIYGIEIKLKKYDNVIKTTTDDNSALVIYFKNNKVYCDIYSIYGELYTEEKVISEELSEAPTNISVVYENNYIYFHIDYKNNNYLKPILKFKDDTEYSDIKLEIDGKIKPTASNPYYIRDVIYDNGYWYSLIEYKNKFYIQKNLSFSGAYIGEKILLSNVYVPTIYRLIDTGNKIGFICTNKIYTVNKSDFNNKKAPITLVKEFANNGDEKNNKIKIVKINDKINKILFVNSHKYIDETTSTIYYIDTDIYIFNYDYTLESTNTTKRNIYDAAIDNNGNIYYVDSVNLTKYISGLTFTDEGVIADKCAQFYGGNSRIEIQNPYGNIDTEGTFTPSELENGLSISLWYKPKTFDFREQVIMGGIIIPEWSNLCYSSYWNKLFMISENSNMLAVGGYEPNSGYTIGELIWRSYDISLEYNISSFDWIPSMRRFIAIGKNSNQYYISENGLEWETYRLDEDVTLNKIKYIKNLNKVFILGKNYIAYIDNVFSDPTNINIIKTPSESNFTDIEYVNDTYVLITDEDTKIYLTDDLINGTWREYDTNIQYIFKSVNVFNNSIVLAPKSGKYLYKLTSMTSTLSPINLGENYDEIKNVKVIDENMYIMVSDNYCITIYNDGTINKTDIVFKNSSDIANDIVFADLCTAFNTETEEWSNPKKYIALNIENADYILADWETDTKSLTKPYDLKETYFYNSKKPNIWINFDGTWESYTKYTWNTLSLEEKTSSIVTDMSLIIDNERYLNILYNGKKFKTSFIFDGSKLNNWYNFIITYNKSEIKFYVNGELYNTFENEISTLQIKSKTITLGDMNKRRNIDGLNILVEVWSDFIESWNSNAYNGQTWSSISYNSNVSSNNNYYNLYGCINDIRFYDDILSDEEIEDISTIKVGGYTNENGMIQTDIPSDDSEFENNLKTDKLYCINKDWSVIFNFKNISKYDKLIFSKADENGGFILSYYDGEKIKEATWEDILRKWEEINENWENVKLTDEEIGTINNHLYLMVYDKRNNKNFRYCQIDDDTILEKLVLYKLSDVFGKLFAKTNTDKYSNVYIVGKKIDINLEHKYTITYNHNDRMLKLYVDDILVYRMFNLEYNNSELPFTILNNRSDGLLSNLEMYHSCLYKDKRFDR